MHRDVQAADRMLSQLGDLLRTVIEQSQGDEVPLRQEIELVVRLDDGTELRATRSYSDRLRRVVEGDGGPRPGG